MRLQVVVGGLLVIARSGAATHLGKYHRVQDHIDEMAPAPVPLTVSAAGPIPLTVGSLPQSVPAPAPASQPVTVLVPAPQPLTVSAPAPQQPLTVSAPVAQQPLTVSAPVAQQPLTVSAPVPQQPLTVSAPVPLPPTSASAIPQAPVPTGSAAVPMSSATPVTTGLHCGQGYTYCGFMLEYPGHNFVAEQLSTAYCSSASNGTDLCPGGKPKTQPSEAVYICMEDSPVRIELLCACKNRCLNEVGENNIAHCDEGPCAQS